MFLLIDEIWWIIPLSLWTWCFQKDFSRIRDCIQSIPCISFNIFNPRALHSKPVLFYSVSYTMHTESSAVLFQLLHLTRQPTIGTFWSDKIHPTTFNRLTLLYFIMHSNDFCRILWIKHMKSIKPLLKCPWLTSRHLCITETFAPGHLWHTRAIPLWQLASGKNLDSFPTKGITPCCFMNLAKMPDDSSYRFLWTSSLHSASLCNTNVSPTYRGISVYLQIKIHDSTHRIPETHQGAISKTPGPKRIPTGTSSPCQRERKLGQDLVKISVLTTYLCVSSCANDLFLPFMFHFEPLPPFPTPPPSMLSPYKGPQCPGAPEDSSNILRHFFMYPNYPTVPYSCRFCSNSSFNLPDPPAERSCKGSLVSTVAMPWQVPMTYSCQMVPTTAQTVRIFWLKSLPTFFCILWELSAGVLQL